MYRVFASLLILGAAFAPATPASAESSFDFSYTAPGGTLKNPGVAFFPLTFGVPGTNIQTLELEVTGLSHPSPADLNIFLVDPFGLALEIMDDRGEPADPAGPVTLIFNDTAASQLPAALPIASGTYLPEGPDAFSQFTDGGTDAWLLLVIDDDPDQLGAGEFDSFTLRGTVPEPATLSLLAFGLAAALRRKRS